MNPDFNEEENFINYELFRRENLEPLGELWDDRLSLADNFSVLLRQTTILPYADIQVPIITAYSLIPSALANIAPILFLWGEQGSGKSSIAILISELYKCEIMSAASRFAAIRTYFNRLRWVDWLRCQTEKICCLVFDNVNANTFQDEQLYSFFLSGYNRKTDKMSISKGNGENIDFKVFGLKVISSIHPIFADYQYAEVARRCIVIKCKKLEKFNQVERTFAGSINELITFDLISLEGLDLSVFHQRFERFWSNYENLLNYAFLKRELTKKNKSFKLPPVFDSNKWAISVELLTSGLVHGIWKDIEQAVNHVALYWQWASTNVFASVSATEQLLRDFIHQEVQTADKVNQEIGYSLVSLNEINAEKLKKHMLWADSQGMLEQRPSPSIISEIMLKLGWRLGKGSRNQICWIQVSK